MAYFPLGARLTFFEASHKTNFKVILMELDMTIIATYIQEE